MSKFLKNHAEFIFCIILQKYSILNRNGSVKTVLRRFLRKKLFFIYKTTKLSVLQKFALTRIYRIDYGDSPFKLGCKWNVLFLNTKRPNLLYEKYGYRLRRKQIYYHKSVCWIAISAWKKAKSLIDRNSSKSINESIVELNLSILIN